MSENQTKPKRVSEGIKIELSKDNSELLRKLLTQADGKIKGSTLNYSKLCNWLFSQHPESFTEDEIQGLNKQFHSDKVYLKWMYEEVARAEAEDRPIPTIEELMTGKPIVIPRTRKPRKSKKVLASENDLHKDTSEAFDSIDNTPVANSENEPFKGRL